MNYIHLYTTKAQTFNLQVTIYLNVLSSLIFHRIFTISAHYLYNQIIEQIDICTCSTSVHFCIWQENANKFPKYRINVCLLTFYYVASIDMMTWCIITRTQFPTVSSINWWGTGKGAVNSVISSRTFYKFQLVCKQ